MPVTKKCALYLDPKSKGCRKRSKTDQSCQGCVHNPALKHWAKPKRKGEAGQSARR